MHPTRRPRASGGAPHHPVQARRGDRPGGVAARTVRALHGKVVGHHFDFEAVALYVLRWDLLRRRATQDPSAARKRFDELMKASWGRYASELQI